MTPSRTFPDFSGLGQSHDGVALAMAPRYFWPMRETSGSVAEDITGRQDGTYINTPTLGGQPGPLARVAGVSRFAEFNGIDEAVQVPVTLSHTPTVTLTFWLWWDAFSTNDDFAFELGPNINGTDGFLINPNAAGSRIVVAINGNGGFNIKQFTQPSGAAWHHYGAIFDTTQPGAGGGECDLYIDGILQSPVSTADFNNTNNFADLTLNMMSRDASSFFGAGRLLSVGLFDYRLAAAQINALFLTGRDGV